MLLDSKRSFQRDIKKIKDKRMQARLKSVLQELARVESMSDIDYDVKPISGSPGFYRIRIGDYRLGVKRVENRLELLHLRHRKEIYQVFP